MRIDATFAGVAGANSRSAAQALGQSANGMPNRLDLSVRECSEWRRREAPVLAVALSGLDARLEGPASVRASLAVGPLELLHQEICELLAPNAESFSELCPD